jgi:hypothetical protein
MIKKNKFYSSNEVKQNVHSKYFLEYVHHSPILVENADVWRVSK